uniref:Uncharacterized protein n=1 Tax=Amphimedon queenslandica TaxID=400682 RepID=A0A1X7TJB6_AMPQE
MYKVLVTVLLVAINVRVLIYKSLIALRRVKCDDNALNQPCFKNRKGDVDSSSDSTA